MDVVHSSTCFWYSRLPSFHTVDWKSYVALISLGYTIMHVLLYSITFVPHPSPIRQSRLAYRLVNEQTYSLLNNAVSAFD